MIVKGSLEIGGIATELAEFPHNHHSPDIIVTGFVSRQKEFEFFHIIVSRYNTVDLTDMIGIREILIIIRT